MASAHIRLALGAGFLLAAGTVPAFSQERGGFFSRKGPSEDATARFASDAVERDAARLYAEARADLDAERHRDAQRKLEVLIARHPQSALIDVARRDLQRLYAILNAPTTQSQPLARAPQPADTRAPGPLAPVAHPGGMVVPLPADPVTAPRSAQPLSPAIRSASEDFRQQAGDRVFFADGSADLGARARFALEAQANWLLRHPDVVVLIEGHADEQGSREINRQLAEQRADAVRLRLSDLGVSDDRMRTVNHGRNDPVADCAEQHCKVQNRRVVTTIVHVPANLGFETSGRRSLGSAANVVGQPRSAIIVTPGPRAP